MKNIIGRKKEVEILNEMIKSKSSELVVVYGRRRVGKTFLVRETYAKQMQFEVSGLHGGGLADQLDNFTKEIRKRTGYPAIKGIFFTKHIPILTN